MEMGKFSEDITLLDVIPFSIGVASDGRNMFKFFEKGAKIPCKHTQVFEINGGGCQAGIENYEGENKLVKYNYPLGKFVFDLDYTSLSYEEKEKKKR